MKVRGRNRRRAVAELHGYLMEFGAAIHGMVRMCMSQPVRRHRRMEAWAAAALGCRIVFTYRHVEADTRIKRVMPLLPIKVTQAVRRI
jgi:hypothetical protein